MRDLVFSFLRFNQVYLFFDLPDRCVEMMHG